MALSKQLGSVKRYGPRYGRRVKHKVAKIESVQRKKHKCPYCHAIKVKRMAAGIWFCDRCKSKFTGKAYLLSKENVSKEVEETPEQVEEQVVEEEEA